jgi:hypothetical protein
VTSIHKELMLKSGGKAVWSVDCWGDSNKNQKIVFSIIKIKIEYEKILYWYIRQDFITNA